MLYYIVLPYYTIYIIVYYIIYYKETPIVPKREGGLGPTGRPALIILYIILYYIILERQTHFCFLLGLSLSETLILI